MRRRALLPADKQPEFDSDVRLANNFRLSQASLWRCARRKFTLQKTGGPLLLQRLWQYGKHSTGRSPRCGAPTRHQKWLRFSPVSDVFPAAGSILCCKILLNTNSPSVHKSAAETRRRGTEKWAKPLLQRPRRESILLLQHSSGEGDMRGNCRRKGSYSASASVQLKPVCTFIFFFLNHKTTAWLSWEKPGFTLLLALFHAAV